MWRLSGSVGPRSRRERTMLRLSVLLILLTRTRTAIVTDSPTFADRLEKMYEKLEKLSVTPNEHPDTPQGRLYAKIDKLNAITPQKFDLPDDDEELLATMQIMGMISTDQLDGIVKDLQRVKEAPDEAEYGDNDESEDAFQEDYAMDWDPEEMEPSSTPTSKPIKTLGVTPSAFTKLDASHRQGSWSVVAEQMALTNQRPTIFDDSTLPTVEKIALRKAVMTNIRVVVRTEKCTPQPKWLSVRRLSPAADTVFLPPSVLLHRCPAEDSGCCLNESHICSPVEGKHVTIPFYVNRAGGDPVPSRIVFYNHTRCDCVPPEALQATVTVENIPIKPKSIDVQEVIDKSKKRQIEWRSTTEEPVLERDEESTSPPQLRRCTCPVLFIARLTESGCNCVCSGPDFDRRRGCQMLARGEEHFGLRDRVCVANGVCHPPACEYGPYNRNGGHCPVRKYRKLKLQYHRGRY